MLRKISFFILLVFIYHAAGQESNCTCVPFYLCVNDSVNINGEGIIDLRLKPVECASYLEVCCGLNQTIKEPEVPSPRSSKTGCGYRNPDGVGYKITGATHNESQFGEFPWVIAIFHKGNTDEKHLYTCVGSLIHPQVVLTAAHNIEDDGNYKIRAGEWDSQTRHEIYDYQNRDVSSRVLHPSYNTLNLQNDVGLLFLESPVDLADHINVACLPPLNTIPSSNRCFVNGWGKDRFEKEGVYQTILKRIEVPVVPRDKCEKDLRQTRLGKYFELHEGFLCAGGEERKDACTGDGGGPLVCPIEGQDERYYQVGIVSWGIGCGGKNIPGVYVDVAHYQSWIEQEMTKKNFTLVL